MGDSVLSRRNFDFVFEAAGLSGASSVINFVSTTFMRSLSRLKLLEKLVRFLALGAVSLGFM